MIVGSTDPLGSLLVRSLEPSMALVTLAVCVAALWLSHDAAAQRLTDRDSRGVISGVVVEAGTGDGVDRTVDVHILA